MAKDAQPLGTGQINQLLWNKLTGNGEHVLLFNVPDAVGTSSKRFADAVSIGMWGSSGRLIQGYEVKASRSDWLRELKQTEKSDPFTSRCDRWWLITGSQDIAKLEEIPACWGWMSATAHGLRVQKPAPDLGRERAPMDRLWAFSLIRRATEASPEKADAMRDQMRKEFEERLKRDVEHRLARVQPEYEALLKRVEKFETDSGMKLEDWRLGNVGKLARALHDLSSRGYTTLTSQLKDHVKELADLQKRSQAVLDSIIDPALKGEDK